MLTLVLSTVLAAVPAQAHGSALSAGSFHGVVSLASELTPDDAKNNTQQGDTTNPGENEPMGNS